MADVQGTALSQGGRGKPARGANAHLCKQLLSERSQPRRPALLQETASRESYAAEDDNYWGLLGHELFVHLD